MYKINNQYNGAERMFKSVNFLIKIYDIGSKNKTLYNRNL